MFAFTYFLQEDRRRKTLDPSKIKPSENRPSLGLLGGFDYFLGLPTLEELAKKQRDIEKMRKMRPIRQKFDWVCIFLLSLPLGL